MTSTKQVFKPNKIHDDFMNTNGAQVGGHSAYEYILPDNGSQPSFGTSVIYKLKTYGHDLLRNTSLMFEVSALTASVGTAEWSNMLAINLWDRIDIKSGGNVIHQIRSENALQTIRKIYDKTHYDAVIAPLIGDLSEADRQTAAGSVQTLYFPISQYFSFLGASFPLYLLNSRDVEIEVYLRPLAKCVINGDNASINDTKLDLKLTDAGNAVVSRINSIVNNNQILKKKGLSLKGWHLNSNWYDSQRQAIPTGTTSWEIYLPSLQNQWIKSIHFTVHANSDLDGGVYDNFIKVDRFALKSGGEYLSQQRVDTTDSFYNKVILPTSRVSGRDTIVNTNLYGIYYTDNFSKEFGDDEKRDNSGSRDFRGVSDAQLELYFDSALSGAHTAIITAVRHNEEIVHNGAIRKLTNSHF